MRHALLTAIVVLAFGCSNGGTSKTTNNGGSDGGADAANNPANNANNGENNVNNGADGGGSDADGSDAGGSDAGGSDAGGSDSGGSDSGTDMGTLPSPCPDSIPRADAACDDDGLQCEYGDDPREACRTITTCEGGTWSVAEPTCDPLPGAMCPMTREEASGTDCDVMDAYCRYGDLVCHCTNCIDGPVVQCEGDPTWMCDAPNTDPDCPAGKPQLGEGCRSDGKECRYECGPNGARVCADGVWQRADGGPCPISTARLKRDVRYLSAAELAEISAALQQIRLARYEYTDPAIGEGEKLGFIIEDLPTNTPAVDRQRMMVDLYGYTSMLVADAQAREKRMRTLEARLAELEAKVVHCAE